MSHKRLTAWQKATALVPLALLSGAWTASLATTSAASADQDGRTRLPDGSTFLDKALEAPASMTRPGSIAPGVPAGAAESVVAGASTNGIPAAALAAYQRAAPVINEADRSCNLTWQLIAAIGRVESDHGRYGGNVLGEDGRSRPGIYGIPLDGSNGTAEIRDSDAGDFDDDRVYDRAVGPMQFIPETWRVVGVDGDGDGQRDPQDIDDAALASAVYLCSGDEDLSTYGGQRAAVYRYNHSEEYVDLVISIMNAYLDGDYSSTPNGVTTAPVLSTPDHDALPGAAAQKKHAATKGGAARTRDARSGGGTSGGGSGSSGGGTGGDGSGAGSPSSPTDPVEDPAPNDDPVKKVVEDTTKKVTDGVKDTGDKVGKTLDDTTEGLEGTVDKTTKELDDTVGGVTGGLGLN